MKDIFKDSAIMAVFAVSILTLMILSHSVGMHDALAVANAEKAALEIKILQHELKAYEAMEKELKSE